MPETKTQYAESLHYYERAAKIPGRSLTRSKAPGRLFDIGAGPLYALRGHGCRLVCVDGHEYIDMLCALGAISLGYGAVAEAVQREVGDGQLYSLPSFLEPIAAELVLEHVAPWASHVRFTKTGSESTQAALMLAQRATGRRPYLRSRASYHGWPSVWQSDAPDVRWFDDGQPMGGMADGCCAIFVEPPRWTPCTREWLGDCRDEATRSGAMLVFDEMIFGGRWALGGATEYFGVKPDMACFGKALGNGAPIAFVAGREAMAEQGELISGTYSGDSAALAALCDTIRIYKTEPVIETMWTRGRQLQRGLMEAVSVGQKNGLCPSVEGEPVHQRIRFANNVSAHHVALGRQFAALMALRGVLWHPDVCNVMYAHSEADIERVVEAAMESMQELARS